jgi:hypothetical protein
MHNHTLEAQKVIIAMEPKTHADKKELSFEVYSNIT